MKRSYHFCCQKAVVDLEVTLDRQKDGGSQVTVARTLQKEIPPLAMFCLTLSTMIKSEGYLQRSVCYSAKLVLLNDGYRLWNINTEYSLNFVT